MIPVKAFTTMGSHVGSPTELVELARRGVFSSVPQIPGLLGTDAVAGALDKLLVGGIAGRIVSSPGAW